MTVIVISSFFFIVQLNVQFVYELPNLFLFEQIWKFLVFKNDFYKTIDTQAKNY
ncbi:hypothetical protein MHA01_27960 [Marinococcus halophilus]|uniref:Uncharacterized protein n=1 Tax=Marinococcus halophilus TaxID=1371 RepID=A0A510YB60_MARHA|nr:hypothetical protein MHA01_27960 [Marinococcus halophilus]